MKIIKVLYTLCIYLTTIPNQICQGDEITSINRAFEVMDAKVQNMVTNCFQYAAAIK